MSPPSWEQTLYAFVQIKAAVEHNRWADARTAIAAALRHAGRTVEEPAPMSDEALGRLPAHWLFVMGNDGGSGAYATYMIPTDALDDDLRAALVRCDGETLSMPEVDSIDPELWTSWMKLGLASGLYEYDDFASVLEDPNDGERSLDAATRESLSNRFSAFDVGRGAGLIDGALDHRFAGATFLFERL